MGPSGRHVLVNMKQADSDIIALLQEIRTLTAQATRSGGVIGTASFTALGGSIASLVRDGLINHIVYDSTGRYVVDFAPEQLDANYIVVASLGGNGADDNWTYNIPVAGKSTAAFVFEARYKGALSDDSDNIQIAVLRLSQ